MTGEAWLALAVLGLLAAILGVAWVDLWLTACRRQRAGKRPRAADGRAE